MDKAEIIQRLNEEHRHLLELVQNFAKSDFEIPIASSEWNAKDMFAHIAYWNWEAQKSIEQVARGERPVMMLDVNFDEFNAREYQSARNKPLPQVMDDFRRSERALVEQLKTMSDGELRQATPHQSGDHKDANAAWIIGGIIEHYQEHAAALQAWLDAKGNT